MTKKIRVGILFGGKSAEHEISLLSAKNVIAALDKNKYEVVLVGIDKNGEWHLRDAYQFLTNADNPKRIQLHPTLEPVTLIPKENGENLVCVNGTGRAQPLDIVFPILHGTYGEDGTVQGLLKMANIPFVGAGVLGSAIGMDKDVMKRLLRDAQIPSARFLTFTASNREGLVYEEMVEQLGLPLFIKPANAGSSVGINKVKNKQDFETAINDAFLYDRKILIEEYVKGREIECSVLGNDHPIVSIPGEIIPQHEFYSYEAKYLDAEGALLEVPAKLDQKTTEKIQKLAVKAYQVLCCEGMARVDFFLKENGDVYVNEINTIPGFTNISMYPKLWEISGIAYADLIDRLITLALDRHFNESQLKTHVTT